MRRKPAILGDSLLEPRIVPTVSLVRDIHTATASAAANAPAAVNGVVYFAANDGTSGSELWRTDGTSAGTVLVRDLLAGSSSSDPRGFTNLNGITYFIANDTSNNGDLWRTDGTSAGTTLVRDFISMANTLTNVNGTLFFLANDGAEGFELWKSNGTNAGTVIVRDIRPGPSSSSGAELTNFNGTLLFVANDGSTGQELWKSDGTSAGTLLVSDILPGTTSSAPFNLTRVGTTLYFSANGGGGAELWKFDGFSATLVADIRPGIQSSSPVHFTELNGTVYFASFGATPGNFSHELWSTDGFTAQLVRTLDTFFSPSCFIDSIVNLGGTLGFTAVGSFNEPGFWISDGTSAGTNRIKNLATVEKITTVGSTAFFTAREGSEGYELWKSNGTSTGTVLVKDIYPFSGSFSAPRPQQFVNFAGSLVFVANDGFNGVELFKSDGTGAGTGVIREINTAPIIAGFDSALANDQYRALGGNLFFNTLTGPTGREFWTSNGTSTGTTILRDINTAGSTIPYLSASYGGPLLSNNLEANGLLFFQAFDRVNGTELWRSDGTSNGTILIADLNPGSAASLPAGFTNANGIVYFRASQTSTGLELWRTDGTSAGTFLVRDIRPGTTTSYPHDLINVNGTLFFKANNGTNGYELWKSDGTSDGTVMVRDILPGGQSSFAYPSNPSNLIPMVNLGGTLIFRGGGGQGGFGSELWRSDGTSDGTALLLDIDIFGNSFPSNFTVVGSQAFFLASDGIAGRELWRTDGTSAGTLRISEIGPGSNQAYAGNLTNVGGTLFFSASAPTSGYELWKSNGTLNGTTMVRDLYTGNPFYSSSPASLTNLNGKLYFSATDGSGRELWTSDGTSLGTVMIDVDAASIADPSNLVAAGNRLFFVANRPDVGRELFKLETAPAVSSITSTSPNGSYYTGQTVNVTVNFSEPVTLTGGNLLVTLDTGTILSIAPFTGSSASAIYTVLVGQSSSDLTVSNLALSVGTATLRTASLVDVITAVPTSNLAVNKDLMINVPDTVPTISDIPNQSTPFQTVLGPIGFTIGDAQTPAAALTLSATSSNPTLVPVANIVFGGSGANRTFTITPAAGQSGTTTIFITVTDGIGFTNADSFVLTVQANTPPTISSIADQSVVGGNALGPIPFTIGDVQTPAAALTLSAASSNLSLIPIGAITFGGSGASRSVSVATTAGLSGTSLITITVTDSNGGTALEAFTISQNSPPTINDIANQNVASGSTLGPVGFTINDAETAPAALTLTAMTSNATLIPLSAITFGGSGADRTISVNTVPGFNATTTITVIVTDGAGFTASDTFTVTQTIPNTPPTISDIVNQTVNQGVTVGPLNFTINDMQTAANKLMVAASSSNAALVPLGNITFSGTTGSRSVTALPLAGQSGTSTITITVTDLGGATASDTFDIIVLPPPNAPPVISDIANRTILANTTTGPIAFTVSDSDGPLSESAVSAASSNPTLLPNANIVISPEGTGRTITLTPAVGQTGTATITITAVNGGTATRTFTLTVLPNTPPTISNIPDQTGTIGTGFLTPINFIVGDAESAPGTLTVIAASSNDAVMPDENISFTGFDGNRTANVFLNSFGMVPGTTTITLTVRDGGLTTSDTFELTILPRPDTPPTITAIDDRTIAMNSTTGPIGYIIGDAQTSSNSLVVIANSSNQSLVPLNNLQQFGIGATRAIEITPTANATGSALITISVSDGVFTTVESFTVTVSPLLAEEFSVGRERGGEASVTLRNPDNTPRYTLTPFGSGFTGGIRTTAADFTGDGVADLVAASGPGRGGQVMVFDGVTQAVLFDFVPFGSGFTRGILVSAGDLNADAKADLIITAEAGGGARVRIFQSSGSGFAQRSDFIALIGGDNVPDSKIFRGGSRATVSDINGDGTGDLIWAAGAGGGPRIATFNGKQLNGGDNVFFKMTGDFFALSTTLRDGAFLAGGDFDGDGLGDLVAGGGSGAPPQVVIFSGANLIQNKFTKYADFLYGDPSTRQGVRVAVKTLDGDNRADLILGSAPTAGSRVTAFAGKNILGGATGATLFEYDAFPGFAGGVFVG